MLEGVKQELLELMAVPHVGAYTARLLHTHRIITVQQLAELAPSTVAQWFRSGTRGTVSLCVQCQWLPWKSHFDGATGDTKGKGANPDIKARNIIKV